MKHIILLFAIVVLTSCTDSADEDVILDVNTVEYEHSRYKHEIIIYGHAEVSYSHSSTNGTMYDGSTLQEGDGFFTNTFNTYYELIPHVNTSCSVSIKIFKQQDDGSYSSNPDDYEYYDVIETDGGEVVNFYYDYYIKQLVIQ